MTKNKKQKGIALIIIVMIVAVVLGISSGISAILSQQTQMMGGVGYSVASFYAADSGAEEQLYALYKLPEGSRANSYSQILTNAASFEVSAKCSNSTNLCYNGFQKDSSCLASNYCVKSKGTFQGVNRSIEIKY
jgi:hypothetical protein